MLEWLARRDARVAVNTLDDLKAPPLAHAIMAQQSESARWLLAHGADPTLRCASTALFALACEMMDARFVRALAPLVPKGDWTEADADGETPARYALMGHQPSTLAVLVELGVRMRPGDLAAVGTRSLLTRDRFGAWI